MEKIRLTNLVQNGSFESDVANWGNLRPQMTIETSICVTGDKCLKVIGSNATYQWCSSNSFLALHNHIYYLSGMVKNNDANTAWGLYGVNDNGDQVYNVSVGPVGAIYNEFTQISQRIIVPSSITTNKINVLLYGEQGVANINLITFWDNIFCLDLTLCFGEGKEPTKDWCDRHLSYFDGAIYFEENGYIFHNQIEDPLFLYHDNASDLFSYALCCENLAAADDAGFYIEKLDGEPPPHSSCFRSWGSAHYNEIYFETKNAIPYVAGHKYYAAMDFYTYENEQMYNLYWPVYTPYPSLDNNGGMVIEKNRPTAIANTWQRASMIVQGNQIASGKYNFRFDNDNNFISGRTLRVTNLMCIDLTVTFGAGNEPGLAWCDKYLVLDSDGTPYIRTKSYGSEYVSNNTNHINFIMRQRSKKVRTKIQSLDYNDNITGEIKGYCTSGNIDITNSDMIRRSVSLDFVANNKLEINSRSPFWVNKRLKIFTGIDDFKGNTYWFDHGIFIPTQPDTSVSLSGRTISIEALDKMILADNPVLTTTKMTVGTPIGNAIRALGELYGESKFMISNFDYTLPYDYEMSAGDNIQEALKEISNLYMNYDIYYDINGFLVFEKQKNRINDVPVWDFYKENDFTIQRKISADYTKIYNDYKVYGYYNDETALQPSYQITITDDKHPFSVNNLRRKHSLVINEDNYLTEEQCRIRAEFEKQQAENLINNFTITTVPIYSLVDVNRVIRVTDNGNRYTCLVDTITYPLDIESPMSVSCHEIFI